jgi:hypothetical protein
VRSVLGLKSSAKLTHRTGRQPDSYKPQADYFFAQVFPNYTSVSAWARTHPWQGSRNKIEADLLAQVLDSLGRESVAAGGRGLRDLTNNVSCELLVRRIQGLLLRERAGEDARGWAEARAWMEPLTGESLPVSAGACAKLDRAYRQHMGADGGGDGDGAGRGQPGRKGGQGK